MKTSVQKKSKLLANRRQNRRERWTIDDCREGFAGAPGVKKVRRLAE